MTSILSNLSDLRFGSAATSAPEKKSLFPDRKRDSRVDGKCVSLIGTTGGLLTRNIKSLKFVKFVRFKSNFLSVLRVTNSR